MAWIAWIAGLALHVEVVAVDGQVGLERRQRLGVVRPGHADGPEQLEVRLPARDVGIDVDQHPVGPGAGNVTVWRSKPFGGIGGWSWMM